MLQKFAATTSPGTGRARLAALRNVLLEEGLAGFIVPRSDRYGGENVAPHDQRLAWLTGFTGSAGSCVALLKSAGIFVDGRYRLQVRSQVDTEVFNPVQFPDISQADWLLENLSAGGSVGYDPWLHGTAEIEKLSDAVAKSQITLTPVENLVDSIWADQPNSPKGRIVPHPEKFAGEPHASKREHLSEILKSLGSSAAVLSSPESIAWLLNIRGSDIERTPVPHCFAILHANASVDLFVDPDKVGEDLNSHMGKAVRLHGPEKFGPTLDTLTGEISVDRTRTPVWIVERLRAANVAFSWQPDPCLLSKATKNETELQNTRIAHVRDAAALARFLCWLEGEAPKGRLTEIDIVRKLENFRRDTGVLRDISFDTICGAGPNGAIVHYRVTEESNRTLEPGEILLVDSGAQYADGTTDVTRTLATGPAEPDAARAFTLVLKGMIAISTARWPPGLAGRDIDPLARAALRRSGFDYDHGTGHGVGSYLGVHEGPQNLSKRGEAELLPGMILSNEPGYYREGAFGIRIENLLVVKDAAIPDGGDRPMLAFETLTLVPIDRRLIETDILTGDERTWLDEYHAQVFETISPSLEGETAAWLDKACAPL